MIGFLLLGIFTAFCLWVGYCVAFQAIYRRGFRDGQGIGRRDGFQEGMFAQASRSSRAPETVSRFAPSSEQ